MTESPFGGTTRDPVALLEQLIVHVGRTHQALEELRQDFRRDLGAFRDQLRQEVQDALDAFRDELRQELAAVRDELRQEFRQELGAVRDELRQEFRQELAAVRTALTGVQEDLAHLRRELRPVLAGLHHELDAVRVSAEVRAERTVWLLVDQMREDWQRRYAVLEQRVSALEEAERTRRAAG